MTLLKAFLKGDQGHGRVVPPSGFAVRLTVFSAAAMAFLAVFAMTLTLAADRLADHWGEALARTATVRISASAGQEQAQLAAVMAILETTEGVVSARALDTDEQSALLAPWLGPDLPLDRLPVPQLVEVVEAPEGIDHLGLRLRLQAEAPAAVFDDHTRWRAPLELAANRLRLLGWVSLVLIGLTTGAVIALSVHSALVANKKEISVLRLVGAMDRFIANAFVWRFTGRAVFGASVGALAGIAAMALLPSDQAIGSFLTGLRPEGLEWALLVLVPVVAAGVAFAVTQLTVLRLLKGSIR